MRTRSCVSQYGKTYSVGMLDGLAARKQFIGIAVTELKFEAAIQVQASFAADYVPHAVCPSIVLPKDVRYHSRHGPEARSFDSSSLSIK